MSLCVKLIIGNVDIKVKIRNVCPGCRMSKFDGVMY